MSSCRWIVIAITLSLCLSCRECDSIDIGTADFSGFGYVCGLCFTQGEVEFTVYSSQNINKDAALRCRLMHLNDAGESMKMTINDVTVPLNIEETTDWQDIPLVLSLRAGNNSISFSRSKPLYYDICIDYLEIQ